MKRRINKSKIIRYNPEKHPANSIYLILTILFVMGFFMLQLNIGFIGYVVFEQVSDFSLNEDFGSLELNLSDNVTNVEEDSLINYTVTLTDNNIVTADFDLINGTGNLTFYSVANQTGSTNVNITAYNTTDAQNSTFFTLRVEEVNDAPEVPALNLPVNNTFTSIIPEFDWSNSSDLEGNETNYTIEISDNITFPYTNFSNSTIIETLNTTKEASVSGLEDSGYYWRVLATDSVDNSSFSETRKFTLDTIPPAEFNLTSPENDTNSTDTTPALAWQETSELNFLNYTIEISNESDFSIINFTFYNMDSVSNNSFSSWNSTEILENTTYYWRATAYDKAGNYNQTDVFVYNVGVHTVIIKKDEIRTQGAGTGKTGGAKKTQQVALDIIQPSPITIFTNDTITTPIFITNKGNTALRDINLKAITNAAYLNLQLTNENLGILLPGQTIALDLIIRSTPETLITKHEVLIEANVLEPDFKDSIKFFIDILEFGFGDKKTALEKIEVANNLFNANPDCSELRSLLERAEDELKKKDFDKALSLVETAIQSCKDIIASLGKELSVEPKITRDHYISIIETIIALLLFTLLYRYHKRRKLIKALKRAK